MNRFMKHALEVSKYSDDPNTQVGCILVNVDDILKEKKRIGIGWNHFPKQNVFPTAREGDVQNTKYPYIIHAEQDAIMDCIHSDKNKISDITEVYVTLFPCSNCAKFLVQAGVKKIFYYDDKYNGTPDNIASKHLLDVCEIKYEQIL